MALKSDGEQLATTLSHLATKADIANLQSTIIKWFVGTWLAALTVLASLLLYILYILSRLPAA